MRYRKVRGHFVQLFKSIKKYMGLLFSHASDMRDKNMPEKQFASMGYWAHNYVMLMLATEPPGGTG